MKCLMLYICFLSLNSIVGSAKHRMAQNTKYSYRNVLNYGQKTQQSKIQTIRNIWRTTRNYYMYNNKFNNRPVYTARQAPKRVSPYTWVTPSMKVYKSAMYPRHPIVRNREPARTTFKSNIEIIRQRLKDVKRIPSYKNMKPYTTHKSNLQIVRERLNHPITRQGELDHMYVEYIPGLKRPIRVPNPVKSENLSIYLSGPFSATSNPVSQPVHETSQIYHISSSTTPITTLSKIYDHHISSSTTPITPLDEKLHDYHISSSTTSITPLDETLHDHLTSLSTTPITPLDKTLHDHHISPSTSPITTLVETSHDSSPCPIPLDDILSGVFKRPGYKPQCHSTISKEPLTNSNEFFDYSTTREVTGILTSDTGGETPKSLFLVTDKESLDPTTTIVYNGEEIGPQTTTIHTEIYPEAPNTHHEEAELDPHTTTTHTEIYPEAPNTHHEEEELDPHTTTIHTEIYPEAPNTHNEEEELHPHTTTIHTDIYPEAPNTHHEEEELDPHTTTIHTEIYPEAPNTHHEEAELDPHSTTIHTEIYPEAPNTHHEEAELDPHSTTIHTEIYPEAPNTHHEEADLDPHTTTTHTEIYPEAPNTHHEEEELDPHTTTIHTEIYPEAPNTHNEEEELYPHTTTIHTEIYPEAPNTHHEEEELDPHTTTIHTEIYPEAPNTHNEEAELDPHTTTTHTEIYPEAPNTHHEEEELDPHTTTIHTEIYPEAPNTHNEEEELYPHTTTIHTEIYPEAPNTHNEEEEFNPHTTTIHTEIYPEAPNTHHEEEELDPHTTTIHTEIYPEAPNTHHEEEELDPHTTTTHTEIYPEAPNTHHEEEELDPHTTTIHTEIYPELDPHTTTINTEIYPELDPHTTTIHTEIYPEAPNTHNEEEELDPHTTTIHTEIYPEAPNTHNEEEELYPHTTTIHTEIYPEAPNTHHEEEELDPHTTTIHNTPIPGAQVTDTHSGEDLNPHSTFPDSQNVTGSLTTHTYGDDDSSSLTTVTHSEEDFGHHTTTSYSQDIPGSQGTEAHSKEDPGSPHTTTHSKEDLEHHTTSDHSPDIPGSLTTDTHGGADSGSLITVDYSKDDLDPHTSTPSIITAEDQTINTHYSENVDEEGPHTTPIHTKETLEEQTTDIHSGEYPSSQTTISHSKEIFNPATHSEDLEPTSTVTHSSLTTNTHITDYTGIRTVEEVLEAHTDFTHKEQAGTLTTESVTHIPTVIDNEEYLNDNFHVDSKEGEEGTHTTGSHVEYSDEKEKTIKKKGTTAVTTTSTRATTVTLNGPWSTGIVKLCEMIILKSPYHVKPIMDNMRKVFDNKEAQRRLSWLGQPMNIILKKVSTLVADAYPDELQHYARLLGSAINDRHKVLSSEVNYLIDMTDNMVSSSQGEYILQKIQDLEEYPRRGDKTGYQLCKSVFDAFEMPFYLRTSTSDRDILVKAVNRALKDRYHGLQGFGRRFFQTNYPMKPKSKFNKSPIVKDNSKEGDSDNIPSLLHRRFIRPDNYRHQIPTRKLAIINEYNKPNREIQNTRRISTVNRLLNTRSIKNRFYITNNREVKQNRFSIIRDTTPSIMYTQTQNEGRISQNTKRERTQKRFHIVSSISKPFTKSNYFVRRTTNYRQRITTRYQRHKYVDRRTTRAKLNFRRAYKNHHHHPKLKIHAKHRPLPKRKTELKLKQAKNKLSSYQLNKNQRTTDIRKETIKNNANRKKQRIHNKALHKIIYSSSYSDEESVLKMNLIDHLMHYNHTVTRKYN